MNNELKKNIGSDDKKKYFESIPKKHITQNNHILKVYWNYAEDKWNLIEMGAKIESGHYKSYVVPEHLLLKSSRLVRIAWKIHLIIEKIKSKI
jgi:hypothetical protein